MLGLPTDFASTNVQPSQIACQRSAGRSAAQRPPADKLRLKRAAAESALAKVVGKLRSRQVVTQARASAAMASIWQEVFEKLQGQAAPVQDWAKKAPEARPVQVLRSVNSAQDRSAMPAMTSTWAEVVEKVRRRQLALKDRAGTLSSSQRR
jgi:hypothetical protein